jgi:hypothetical protein
MGYVGAALLRHGGEDQKLTVASILVLNSTLL